MVATTIPVPIEVFSVKKIHGKPYLVVRSIPSISEILFPYLLISSFLAFVWKTSKNVESEFPPATTESLIVECVVV